MVEPIAQPQAGGICYEIRIRGHLHDRWLSWFEGFSFTRLENGETILSGSVTDLSALYGVLDRLRDLNLELISLHTVRK